MQKFHSVQDVLEAVKQMRDGLGVAGHQASAKELDDVLETYFSSSTECLGEIREALNRTRPAWTGSTVRSLGEHVVKEATRLMHLE